MIAIGAAPRAARRAAFYAYALLIATLTHWPSLSVEAPFDLRVDILIHGAVFGGWTVLLTLAEFFDGEPLSPRNVIASAGVSLAYAPLDELTQGIPALHRTVDALDLAANCLGVLGAALTLAVISCARARRRRAIEPVAGDAA